MPSSIRSNKEKHLLFSEDPAHLERTIHKGQRSTSLDASAVTSTDSRTNPSTDTRPSSSTDIPRSTSIDPTPLTSIDPQSQNMVATVILRHDENGDLNEGWSSFNRINALRPPPKPLANPPEATTNPSDTTPEQVDEATEGRVLRKRKEKTPKNLKREANEKETDGFTKRVLRIPVEKQFDEVYFTHRLWMFFRETKETEEDIRRMFHHVRERMKLMIILKKKSDPGKFAIPCLLGNDLGYIAACHCGAEYETEYSESINTHTVTSIDSNESPTIDERYPTSLDGMQPVDHSTLPAQYYPDFAFQQPNKNGRDDYSIGSWADSGFHESFAVETVILSSNEDTIEEFPSLSVFAVSDLGLLFGQLFLFVPIENFLLFCHWLIERRDFPSRSAPGPSRMYVSILLGIVGDVVGIQVDVLDFINLRGLRGRWRTLEVSFLGRGCFARVLARRSFPRCSRPVEWGCEVESFPANLRGSVANIFLNSSSVAALAGALAAETSTAGVWRIVSLPPLRGVCTLSALSVDMFEKHPHPPSPHVKIDRPHEPAIDRQRETDIDRPPSPPIDRRTPLTHRVQLPSIDSNRINALRPPPKPLANPPEPTTNPSDTTPEPMQVDEAAEGRVLRKRKEKTPKNLKREANEKEMDGFTKSVLRIPVEKQFDEFYITHSLWMFFRETKETEDDIRRMFHHLGNDLGYIAACHCGAEYEIEYSELINTHTVTSIDSNESPTTDERCPTSLDGMKPVDHSTLPDQYYPDIAFQQTNKNGRDDYSIGKEYDEDYWKERATKIAMQDERYSTHSFNNTPTPSIDIIYSASVDSHPHLAKQTSTSIDTTPGTSIDIKAAASEKEKGNIPISNKFNNTYVRSFAPRSTSHETEAEKMNAPTHQSEGTSRRSIRSKNPNSADKRLPSIDTSVSTSIVTHSKPKLSLSTKSMSNDYDFLLPDEFGIFRDQDGHARAMDGRILQVSREDIADIVQLANGVDNLFTQQRIIPDNNPTVLDVYPKATTTGIGSHQTCKPVSHASIDEVASTSLERPESSDGNIRTNMESTETSLDIQGAQLETLGDELKTLVDDTYQPLDRGYNELFRCMAELRTEIESMQHNREKEATTSTLIDANKGTSIDVKPQTSQIPAKPESFAEKKDEWEIAYINTRINDHLQPSQQQRGLVEHEN
ncbi:hypothetical protein F2Q69_00021613 [Brassica cretica]|uniref:Uncharacterized protein n=1 Tax=Brassica cretica TaxID=69181 RepID=A0A8S9Q6X2_BRACR|nr:hypothetical protein F2Q69_00021613 [Brassica cretica]